MSTRCSTTWTWHLPCEVADTIREAEERGEDGDRFTQVEGEDMGHTERDEGGEGIDDGDDDVGSLDSRRVSFSTRSLMSISSVKWKTSKNMASANHLWLRSIDQAAVFGGRSARNVLTGHARSLHTRLEVILRVLQFPFSQKLSMLERLSTLQDANAFSSILERWERVSQLVAVQQRMKLALSGYTERGELQPNGWLTASELSLLSGLIQVDAATKPIADTLQVTTLCDELSPAEFVDWVSLLTQSTNSAGHENPDTVTQSTNFS